ncbi:MAG: MFS transporter [Dehalococcoidia bacterium]|nr:MFS transporter [Dehalococcoidia bacterium]
MATPTATPSRLPGVPRAPRRKVYWGYYIVAASLTAQFVAVGAQTSVAGAFLVPMTEDLGWTRADFAYSQSIGRFVMAFAGFFVGVYVDRYGGRPLMVVGATILAAAIFTTSYVTELWQWIALRGVVLVLGAALVGNLVVNVTISKWFVEKRGRVIGVSSMGVSLAGAVMPLLATWYIEEWGWRAAWKALAVLAVLLLYPASTLMRRSPEDYGLHPDGRSDEEMSRGAGAAAQRDFDNSFTRAEALRTRSMYLIILAFGFGGVGIGTMLLHTIPFVQDEGFSAGTAALMSTTMSIPAFVSKPIWGFMMDRYEAKRLASVGFALSAAAMVIIVLSAKANSLPTLTAGFLLLGWGFGGQIPLQETIWATYFGRRYLGAVRSAALPFSLILGAGGPLAVAFYFDRVGNYDGAFFIVGACWAIASLLVLLVKRPIKRAPAPVLAPSPQAPQEHPGATWPSVTGPGAPPEPNGATPEPNGATPEGERGEAERDAEDGRER